MREVLGDEGLLSRVEVVQPASWAVMVSLAVLWRAAGVEPAAVVGHSQGEIAAACVAGGLSLEDGARVVALRSRALAGHLAGTGGMVSVPAGLEEVGEWISRWGQDLSVAAVNAPRQVVVAGAAQACVEFVEAFADRGARRVAVDYASHTAHVEAVGTAVSVNQLVQRTGVAVKREDDRRARCEQLDKGGLVEAMRVKLARKQAH